MLVAGLVGSAAGGLAQATPQATAMSALKPHVSKAAAFDKSKALRVLARKPVGKVAKPTHVAADRGAHIADTGFTGDAAVQTTAAVNAAIKKPVLTFEGISNADNNDLYGFTVSPPDPDGDVGPNHYVEIVNLAFAVYSKTGTQLLGPVPLGALWDGFAVDDCTDPSGDPIVLHDQLADRWILTQFTTRGPTFYNCVAVSQTANPTGAYFRYAFSTGVNFPDYPKYGVWPNAYFLSTREFAPDDSFAGIGAYALERDQMLVGDPAARVVSFLFPPGTTPYLTGDGLLPTDLDGSTLPPAGSANYFVGTMDDGAQYGAPFDGINVFAFSVDWLNTSAASFTQVAQLPVAAFDSIFPCRPGSRNCIHQPDTKNKVDILSYRQRPTWRLAYRNFGSYETFVTNQSVEAQPVVAGVRWYELRLVGGQFSVYQQGTFAPGDTLHRWMGSAAMDSLGNIALGYSVSNRVIHPGIRYTGRLSGDPLGEMTLGEAVLKRGTGSQLVSARWGDYTSLNVDPTDDCTFWYVNEYYETSSARGWQTRIGSFRLPGC
jgi:hypothetical protein